MIDSPLALVTTIAATTALAFLLERHVKVCSKIGAALLAIFLGALLSNLGIVTPESPVYDNVAGPVTSLAIVWILFAVDLSDLKRAGAPMLAAFGIAVLGTAAGSLTSALVFREAFPEDAWRLAGTMTGSFSGGAVNFVAMARGLELPDSLFAGMLAADAVTTAIWLGACLLLPLWLHRFFPATVSGDSSTSTEAVQQRFFGKHPVSVTDVSLHLAVGLLVVTAAQWMASIVPQVPAVLWLTTLALLVGRVPRLPPREGALQLGNLGLHLFFVVVGTYAQLTDIATVGVEILFFTLAVIGVHGLVVFGIGRLARLDVGSLTVASQAAVGGPPTALAVAVSREWEHLMLPGVVIGLLGYAVGNYLGFGVAFLTRALTMVG